MMPASHLYVGRIFVVGLVALGIARTMPEPVAVAQGQSEPAPRFELDPSWPKPLPNNWMFGQVWGVAVDSKDHVWVIHNPKGGWPLGDNTVGLIKAAGKVPAPAVVEFDTEGKAVQGWGGDDGPGYNWMQRGLGTNNTGGNFYATPAEHAVFIDYKDNVWVVGNGHLALKFTPAGKFLLQIGELWRTNGSNDTRLLGNPSDLAVDPKTNEVYIADGYVNHRVIVFDADTGKYKRHWGAYGLKPSDGPVVKTGSDVDGRLPGQWPLPQWWSPAHAVRVAKDGLVYVGDRRSAPQKNRVQVFQTNGKFVKEVFIPSPGGASGVTFSADPQQRYLYVTGGKMTSILRRSDLQILGSFETRGNHYIATDSKGNLYINGGGQSSDVIPGPPVSSAQGMPQRFLFKGVRTTAARNR